MNLEQKKTRPWVKVSIIILGVFLILLIVVKLELIGFHSDAPELCRLQPGIGCKDFRISPINLTLGLQNSFGKEIYVTSITANQTKFGRTCRWIGSESINITDDSYFRITNCRFVETGKREEFSLLLAYYFADSSVNNTLEMPGGMRVRIES